MLNVARRPVLRVASMRIHRALSSTANIGVGQPNAPIELDPSLKSLLHDADMSLSLHKERAVEIRETRELEAFPTDAYPEQSALVYGETVEEDDLPASEERKSPAALFGSNRVRSITIPLELQTQIQNLITQSDRSRLHSDAKRLFLESDNRSSNSTDAWKTQYDTSYRSHQQAARHYERDGTAFASVALPAHYSAIYSVLDHLKRRLGPEWSIRKVMDWGAGTGSGLWASAHAFQRPLDSEPSDDDTDPRISQSDLVAYLGIDKRAGLITIGKRLVQSLDVGSTSISWQKTFHDDDKNSRGNSRDTLALSAFTLSSLSTPLLRKTLVKEMWESGADIMVLIDHSTPEGFQCIAEAREYLLSVGRKEFDDPATTTWESRGSHVVAPCPHDGTCPLFHSNSTKVSCTFSQRLQRPSFVRLTKHSKAGHEDIGYSYVVIRRGVRPQSDINGDKVGRVGGVGRRALKSKVVEYPRKELALHNEQEVPREAEENTVDAGPSAPDVEAEPDPLSDIELQEALRLEAYSWPRLVFPPLKKSGHIILDCCTAEEKIMRITIPKSQGKQPYYDARKSTWGDIFPHEPKNAPQERYKGIREKLAKNGPSRSADIGKRDSARTKTTKKVSYDVLSRDLKEQRRQQRRERVREIDASYH